MESDDSVIKIVGVSFLVLLAGIALQSWDVALVGLYLLCLLLMANLLATAVSGLLRTRRRLARHRHRKKRR